MIKSDRFNLEELVYQEGDVILAKCEGTFPWPATIHSFRGYDELQEQLYKVSFVGGGWAYVKDSQIAALSFAKIIQLKEKFKTNHSFTKALTTANRLIEKLGERLGGFLKIRFEQIYMSEVEMNWHLFSGTRGHQQIGKMIMKGKDAEQSNSVSCRKSKQAKLGLNKKWLKYKRLTYVVLFQGTITITTVGRCRKVMMTFGHQMLVYEDYLEEQASNGPQSALKVSTRNDLIQLESDHGEKDLVYSLDSTQQESSIGKVLVSNDEQLEELCREIQTKLNPLSNYMQTLNCPMKLRKSSLQYEQSSNLDVDQRAVKLLLPQIVDNFNFNRIVLTSLVQNVAKFMSVFAAAKYPEYFMRNTCFTSEKHENVGELLRNIPIISLAFECHRQIQRWQGQIEQEVQKQQRDAQNYAKVVAMQTLQSLIVAGKRNYVRSMEPLIKVMRK